MATIDTPEYKFPDEVEDTAAEDSLDIEIEDDTPAEDRGKKPMPKEVVDELETDELDDYSDKAKERLKQLKKVWHDERREKDAARREQQEAINAAQALFEENKRLKATLKTGEEEYISTMQYAADRDLESAKEKYKKALESYDNDQVVEAQHELTEATLRADKAKNFKPTLQEAENEVQLPKTQAQPQSAAPDGKYANWVSRNETWFQKDPEMTQAAFGLHEKLAQQYGSQYIGTDDYYKRIDTTIRKRFPEAFQTAPDEDDDSAESKPQRKTSTVVASAKRSTAPRQIKLTATQAALAKKFKLTPEQYAREVLKLENK
jgi:DNA repair ATPase RecN